MAWGWQLGGDWKGAWHPYTGRGLTPQLPCKSGLAPATTSPVTTMVKTHARVQYRICGPRLRSAQRCPEDPWKSSELKTASFYPHSTFPFWFRVNFIPLACSLHGTLFDHRAEVGNRAFLPGHRLLTLTPSSNYFSDTVHFAVSSSEVASFFSSYTSSFDSPIPESTEKVVIEDSRSTPTHMEPSSTRHSSHDG